MKPARGELLKAYRCMQTIREFEGRVAREFEAGTVPGFTHLYLGQEAVAAGVCIHLGDDDYISSTHRGHGHCIAKGCDIRKMALELWCKRDGLCKGKGGSMHIADISKGMLGANAIVGAGAPLALGAALAARVQDKPRVSITFIGDGATNQGAVFECMNLAVVLKLPLIFVVENNGYGEFTGVSYHLGSKDISTRCAAFGMPAVTVDGTDFFAMYGAMGEAATQARGGGGPSTIVAEAPRWRGHFEGDPQVYRVRGEARELQANRDPLKLFRQRVTERDWLTDQDMNTIDLEVATLVDEAVDAAKAAADPLPEDLLTDVYGSY